MTGSKGACGHGNTSQVLMQNGQSENSGTEMIYEKETI